MSYKVEEKVAFRNRDNFVRDLDEQTEPFRRPQIQPLRDILAEVFRPRRRIDLECLRSVKRSSIGRRNEFGIVRPIHSFSYPCHAGIQRYSKEIPNSFP